MDSSIVWLIFFLSVMWIYSILIDMLHPDHFKETMFTFFGNFSGSNHTHSLVDVARVYTHNFAVALATSLTTIISYVPKFAKHPKTVFVGLFASFLFASMKQIFNINGFGLAMLKLGNFGYSVAVYSFICMIRRIKILNEQEQTRSVFVKKITSALLTIIMIGVFFAAENSDFSYDNFNSYYIRFEKANFGSTSHWIKFLIEILMEFKDFFSKRFTNLPTSQKGFLAGIVVTLVPILF